MSRLALGRFKRAPDVLQLLLSESEVSVASNNSGLEDKQTLGE